MAIDPILSLAFSIHSNPGVYAVLLGSGVSRAAGIPTGWDIVLDLTRKLSTLCGESCEPDPEAWYRTKFGEAPNYSKLLEELAKSPAERNQLLRGYFEPTPQDREEGKKVPTAAHKAIASLISKGYIRVVVSTNFDRLLESALEEVGITPTVIGTSDSIKGALPLIHTKFLLIKVHGDYLDTRIKNAPSELESYDEPLNELLDRIFNEFGLIVSGWSAEWDLALCSALERCRSHIFATYWTLRGDSNQSQKKLIQQRQANAIQIKDADSFFSDLEQKVISLEEIDKAHPLSAQVAAASLKRYLSDERFKIQAHDLIYQEANKLREEFSTPKYSLTTPFNLEEYAKRIHRYESLTEILEHLFLVGFYWAPKAYIQWWIKCLERVIIPPQERTVITLWENLRYYPSLILFYIGGLSSIIYNNYENLASLFTLPQNSERGAEKPLILRLAPIKIIGNKEAEIVFKKLLTEHLEEILRAPLKEYLSNEDEYVNVFDRFEYLFALVYADIYERQFKRIFAPVGSFQWRNRGEPEKHIINRIRAEVVDQGENWAPLTVGLFNGSLERFQFIEAEFLKLFSQIPDF
jgi:hypothetical protein